MSGDYYVLVDSIFPLQKQQLILTSGMEISAVEKREVQQKVSAWLAL